MKKRNKIRARRVAVSTIVFAILGSMLLSTLIVFQKNNSVYADGLSVQDTLLIKILKIGMEKCFDNGSIRGSEINSSSKFGEAELFAKDKIEYERDGTVLLPFKYGKGNTVKDGNLSCQQLFNSYTDPFSNDNAFHTFKELGGKETPPYNGINILENNKFLEAFGYVSDDSISSSTVCAEFSYKASLSTNLQTSEYKTNKICIDSNTDDKGNISTPFPIDSGNSENLKLVYEEDRIKLMIKTNSSGCTTRYTEIASSMKVGESLKKGKSTTEIINSLGDKLSKDENILEKAKADGENLNARGDYRPCSGKTLKEELNATNISVGGVAISSIGDNTASSNANEGRSKRYTRPNNARNINGLLEYYVPAFEYAPITPLERAYYWYYLLKDVYQGLSVDTTVPNTCVEDKGSAGQNYLPYYNVAKKQNNEEDVKVQYCILDSANLTHRSGERIMDDADLGMVNSITPENYMKAVTVNEVLGYLQNLNLLDLCNQDANFPLCKANPIECAENPDQAGCKDLVPNATGNSEEDKEGEQAACMQKAGALGWMICPLMYGLRDTAQGIFEKAVTPMLVVHTSIVKGLADTKGEGSALYQAWSFFRNVANILFVIAMLFVIFSQITGFGIDNYGIKKILPKLIITAIIVNFSYIICGIVVDISNITGDALRGIFENIAKNTTGTPDRATITSAVTETIASLLGFVAGTVSLAVPVITGATAIAGGSFLAFIFPILAFIGSAALAGLFAMLMLGLRQALIIVMIAMALALPVSWGPFHYTY